MNRRPQSDLPRLRADAPPGLFLARDGTWFHDGQAVDHARLAALLHRSIARDGGGALVVTTGRDVLSFQAEDAPFLVRSVHVGPTGITLELSDESVEPFTQGPAHIDAEGRIHVRVKDGRFWALLSRSAAQLFLARVNDDGTGIDGGSRVISLLLDARGGWLD